MKKSTPKYRGQRISHAELVAESRETLREAGVGNHERAMFISELSKAVVGNKSPLLYQIQPRVRFHTSKAWKKAYDIIFSYIAENNLEKTLETIGVEMGENLQQTSKRVANEPGANFDYILNVDRTIDTFNQKVKRYTAMTSESESVSASEQLFPNQRNRAIQNTPEKRIRQSPVRQTQVQREEETKTKETQIRRVKKVKRVKKTSEYDITLDTRRSEQLTKDEAVNTVNPVRVQLETISPTRQQTYRQKLPPTRPAEEVIDTSNYSKNISPDKTRLKRKPIITGGDYVIKALRQSNPSEYEISQSEIELSEKDMQNDIFEYSNE